MRRLLQLAIVGAAAWRVAEALRLGGLGNVGLALGGVFLVGLLAGARLAIWSLSGRRPPAYTQITPGEHP